ncbi:MAG: hypothetical protein IJ493_02845 [Clostridia bacterium]|nr:hypothetical protein [Clostridia bacterium]
MSLNGGPEIPFEVVMAIGILFLFAVQAFCCFKLRRAALKLIPVYILVLLFFLTFLYYHGFFDTSSWYELGAAIMAILLGIISIGDLAAWVLYGIIWLVRRHKRKDSN